MRPIRQGDGTGISDVRLGDGTQIGEVRKGDGTVLWSAGADIPDSANLHASFIMSLQPESDGQTVDPLVDQTDNGYDGAAVGGPTMDIDGFNANPAAVLDGADDAWDVTMATLSQPFTVYAVARLDGSEVNSRNKLLERSSSSGGDRALIDWNSGNWRMYAGNSISGSADETQTLLTGVFDGASSLFFENESQTGGGDAGTNSLRNPSIGYDGDGTKQWWNGAFVEMHLYDARHGSSTRSEVWSWIKNRTF